MSTTVGNGPVPVAGYVICAWDWKSPKSTVKSSRVMPGFSARDVPAVPGDAATAEPRTEVAALLLADGEVCVPATLEADLTDAVPLLDAATDPVAGVIETAAVLVLDGAVVGTVIGVGVVLPPQATRSGTTQNAAIQRAIVPLLFPRINFPPCVILSEALPSSRGLMHTDLRQSVRASGVFCTDVLLLCPLLRLLDSQRYRRQVWLEDGFDGLVEEAGDREGEWKAWVIFADF